MTGDYTKCVRFWDEVFSSEQGSPPSRAATGNADFDRALNWLCQGAFSLLDFGCGNGSCLLVCALLGVREGVGIDLSEAGVREGERRAARMGVKGFHFLHGSVEELTGLAEASMDAVLLSYILDNLYPGDALALLEQVRRILRPGGKALVKLTPWLTPEQIRDWDVKVIEGDLLDDGLLLWNQTTQAWERLLSRYFLVAGQETIYYPEHEQENRLFFLTKP